jgi:rubredoxin
MSKKNMYCPNCLSGIHLNDAVYCYTDGVRLEERPVCPHCGGGTLPSYTFCHLCGMSKSAPVERVVVCE